MLSEASEQLAHDHLALNGILKQLQEALNGDDVAAIHSHLDLFWARLAVHIRAEHLHLFPTVINALREKTTEQSLAPKPHEAQLVVEHLREDHEFFMHQLGEMILTVRELLQPVNRSTRGYRLKTLRRMILEIEERLGVHNDTEENQIYRWTTNVLSEEEQTDLSTRINRELANRPPRFDLSSWSNQ